MMKKAKIIAEALARSNSGERAAARRMDEGGAGIFWRLVAELNISETEERDRWRRFTRMLAILTPPGVWETVHLENARFGEVLAEKGFSKQRFERLLASYGDKRLNALDRAIRRISRQRPVRLNVADLARVVINDDDEDLRRHYFTRYYHRNNQPQTHEEEK